MTIKSINLRLCHYMEEAGITEPESQAGIDLCLECPSPHGCILFDTEGKYKPTSIMNHQKIKALLSEGIKEKEIAAIMGLSIRQIQRYKRRVYDDADQ